MAPSQASAPTYPPVSPAYPFQSVCTDFFHYKGINYLVIVDHYSNWPTTERAQEGSTGLIDCLQRTFTTFGISDECAADGDPKFTAAATHHFLKEWGVHDCLSSVTFPHSNCHVEIDVKSVNHLIPNNTDPNCSLNTDSLEHAILQYCNIPDLNVTKLSPAQCAFGRPIKDFSVVCEMWEMDSWKMCESKEGDLEVGERFCVWKMQKAS